MSKRVKQSKIPELFCTDFYQLSMAMVYIMEDMENEEVVFEAFVRNIRKTVNPKGEYYIFQGAKEVCRFIGKIRYDLKYRAQEMLDLYLKLILPKVPFTKKDFVENKLRCKWENLNLDFEVSIYPEGGVVKPYVPVFQYKGPRWIGQMIETRIVNIINGRTGVATRKYLGLDKELYDEYEYLIGAVQSENREFEKKYEKLLRERAVEYRETTRKPLLEAGFRRAAGLDTAIAATKIALDCGWDATSNVASYFKGVSEEKIGGSCAHSFIMAFEKEEEAFKTWEKYFPKSTFLVDTYDVEKAVEKIIENKLEPRYIRIDCEPIDELTIKARKMLDKANRQDIGIFISSDLTPEMLKDFEERQIPFDISMAGTKFVNVGEVSRINCGFVYKLVVNKIGKKIHFPEKKSNGKITYAGYKKVDYQEGTIRVERTENEIGISDIPNIDNVDVEFIGF